MKTKHTPGPIRYTRYPFVSFYTLVTVGGNRQVGTTQTEEDAKLYAAAPDLLEAARAAVKHVCSTFECGDDLGHCPAREYLRAAIAKACER